jgi:hypothetical protein
MRIGVDCEFSFDADNEFFPVCAAVTQEDGSPRTWWYDELDSLKEYILSHKEDTWVAHNVETAEGYLWQYLGLRPTHYRWYDTLMLSRVARNKCSQHLKHDLASVLYRELRIKLDEKEKHDNQKICVWAQDCTWEEHLRKLEGNRQRILDYCLSDTTHLPELGRVLDKEVRKVSSGFLDKAPILEPPRRSYYFSFMAAYASEISWAGIPMSSERVSKLLRNAPAAMARAQGEFMAKYPGAFRAVHGRLTKNVEKCREYAAGVYGDNPPKTPTGAVSLASEYTKPYKDVDNFLGNYYNLDKKCRALASFSKPNREKNWLGMYLPKRGVVRPRLNMLGTQTGRCGSKPSTGFVYTMGKMFRGLVDPPEGYVIVELDFHSEEIGCQAYLSGDTTMAEMYEGPDYYTAIAQRMDPTVKDKHDPKRKKYKVISLMSNYGCGVHHLSEIAGIPEGEARVILQDLKKMFRTYWRYVRAKSEVSDGCRPLLFSDGFRVNKQGGRATSLGNWPFQGVGALILRRLLIRLWQKRIHIVAPVHDAVVFMAPEATWREVSEQVAGIMREVSLECLGHVIDVGDPEVTYHGIPNCHSELSTREEYAKAEPNKYLAEFMQIMDEKPEQLEPDSTSLYVDEPEEFCGMEFQL